MKIPIFQGIPVGPVSIGRYQGAILALDGRPGRSIRPTFRGNAGWICTHEKYVNSIYIYIYICILIYVYIYSIYLKINMCVYYINIYSAGHRVRTCGNFPKRLVTEMDWHLEPAQVLSPCPAIFGGVLSVKSPNHLPHNPASGKPGQPVLAIFASPISTGLNVLYKVST